MEPRLDANKPRAANCAINLRTGLATKNTGIVCTGGHLRAPIGAWKIPAEAIDGSYCCPAESSYFARIPPIRLGPRNTRNARNTNRVRSCSCRSCDFPSESCFLCTIALCRTTAGCGDPALHHMSILFAPIRVDSRAVRFGRLAAAVAAPRASWATDGLVSAVADSGPFVAKIRVASRPFAVA